MKTGFLFLSLVAISVISLAQPNRIRNLDDENLNKLSIKNLPDLVLSNFRIKTPPTPYSFQILGPNNTPTGQFAKQHLIEVEFTVKNTGRTAAKAFSIGFETMCTLAGGEKWFFSPVSNQVSFTPESRLMVSAGCLRVKEGLLPNGSIVISCYVAVANNKYLGSEPTRDNIAKGFSGVCPTAAGNPGPNIRLRCIVDYPEVSDVSMDVGVVKEREEKTNNRFTTSNIMITVW